MTNIGLNSWRPFANCNTGLGPIYPTAKNEQYTGTIFSWIKTARSQKEWYGAFEQDAKTGSPRYPSSSEPEKQRVPEIILKGCSSLAERFFQIDSHLVQRGMENAKKNSQERILHTI